MNNMVLFVRQPEPTQPEPEVEVEQDSDIALADSFINFDYVPDSVEDKPLPDNVPTQQNNTGSDPFAVEPEGENLGDSGCHSIEERIEKISLVSGCGSSVGIGENGDNGDGVITENESESSESESDTTSSSWTSSESGSDSEDEDEDEDEEKEEEEKEEEQRVEEREIEEGEIIESDDGRGGGSGGDDDDDGNHVVGKPIRSKNELEILPSVPPVNVTLEPHHQMLPVGVVMSVLGAQVIVEGVEKHDPLNEGSILWMTESRTPLGLIDEIFGPVKNPYYVVRYNSENDVPMGIRWGTLISFVPEYANHVLNNKDLYNKGYDASGLYDEEVSDEADFSDDEKEAEYMRMKRMTKRGINDQNSGKRKNNKKNVPPNEGVVPTFPVATPTPFTGIGQGPFGATPVVSPFPSSNAGPNLTTSGAWTNGTTFPQPQAALLPNGFPTTGVSWYLENTQSSHQLPVPGIPFQQQLNPSHGFPPASMFPGVQPNIYAQPMSAQGPVGQSPMTFGLRSPFIQPPICAQQGFSSGALQSETNSNLHSSSIPVNYHSPYQFNPGASGSRGRKTFHRGGRRGWRSANWRL